MKTIPIVLLAWAAAVIIIFYAVNFVMAVT